MSHSLNEVHALAVRAARGAGLDWGMAEEAGFAVRWLSGVGLPGARLLARRLTGLGISQPQTGNSSSGLEASRETLAKTPSDGSVQQIDSTCPLTLGALTSDRARLYPRNSRQTLPEVYCPLLLMPFLWNVAEQCEASVSVTWSGQRLLLANSRLWWFEDQDLRIAQREDFDAQLDTAVSARIEWAIEDGVLPDLSDMPEVARTQSVRAPLGERTLECLQRLAARTYAPATEESRRLGAGGADES